MDDIMTVARLRKELDNLPDDARIMVAVVKYPQEFSLRPDTDGELRWDLGTDTECHPLEVGEVTLQRGLVYITVELEDYEAERHAAQSS